MESTRIREFLFAMQDPGYKEFNAKLIPNIGPDAMIGVRAPNIHKLARKLKNQDVTEFLHDLPHKYLEENILHADIISSMKDEDACIEALDAFLPCVDNWSVCDGIKPRVLSGYPDRLLCKIREWIGSEHTYMVRFAIGMLMTYYLDDLFDTEYADMICGVTSDEYYVNMMRAWFFATALAKQYDAVLPYLENKCMDKWTHNKTIQKAVESYRVTDTHKEQLKALRRRI